MIIFAQNIEIMFTLQSSQNTENNLEWSRRVQYYDAVVLSKKFLKQKFLEHPSIGTCALSQELNVSPFTMKFVINEDLQYHFYSVAKVNCSQKMVHQQIFFTSPVPIFDLQTPQILIQWTIMYRHSNNTNHCAITTKSQLIQRIR